MLERRNAIDLCVNDLADCVDCAGTVRRHPGITLTVIDVDHRSAEPGVGLRLAL